MPKKKRVVDIYIPKKGEERRVLEELRKKKIAIEGKQARPELKLPSLRFEGVSIYPSSKGKKVLLFSLPFLALVLVFFYFKLPKADIEIIPRSEILKMNSDLTVDESVADVDSENKIIPGKLIEDKKTASRQFEATGKIMKEEKAGGTITVYNEYSTADQVLVATTRFVSTDGKLFRTPIRVTIPGGHYDGGKLVPGEIDIRVVADEAGPEYNIEATTFSIPGFAGTSRYTKFYAKSLKPMTGGALEGASQVTKEDLEKAEYELIEEAKEECANIFKSKFDSEGSLSGYVFSKDAIKTEVISAISSREAQEEGDNFIFSVEVKVKTIAFKKSDLNQFAREMLLLDSSRKENIYEKSLKVAFSPKTIDLNSGKVFFTAVLEGKIYTDIDIEELKDILKGKTMPESIVVLDDQSGIVRANLELWPFWVKKVPQDIEKININLKLD